MSLPLSLFSQDSSPYTQTQQMIEQSESPETMQNAKKNNSLLKKQLLPFVKKYHMIFRVASTAVILYLTYKLYQYGEKHPEHALHVGIALPFSTFTSLLATWWPYSKDLVRAILEDYNNAQEFREMCCSCRPDYASCLCSCHRGNRKHMVMAER